MPDTIGTRIKTARVAAGLTVRELAELALGRESNARLIHNWETDRFAPSVASLLKIAPYLNVAVADLIPVPTNNEAA